MEKFLIATILTSVIAGAGYIESHYTRKNCIATEVTPTTVIFEDSCGMEWKWIIEENETFKVNDRVNLKMYTSGTHSNIMDDKILKVEKVN